MDMDKFCSEMEKPESVEEHLEAVQSTSVKVDTSQRINAL